ncbi:TetR/AcrR family transcriptional regulator [Dyadobacter tibetensis]|uniref:TetR/AcrR family transcriptional regulator n=1 Tax=Dyadobacter tibetensis TaxID=1211851 RepID=UPI0004703731|nr:TetR/AcrR family transcriptional regulator [Dyadobacter tibetensis]
MPRKKEYTEEEVIEKAMRLFWRNGFESTSMQMLEKEMGINKFSIYSSFGNKQGVFTASLKCYKDKLDGIFKKFRESSNGVEDIKTFFYDSVEISNRPGNEKGCLVTSTYNESHRLEDQTIKKDMQAFMEILRNLFIQKLSMDKSKTEEEVLKQANFLLLAKHGLAAASRVNTAQEIEDYIELTFRNI